MRQNELKSVKHNSLPLGFSQRKEYTDSKKLDRILVRLMKPYSYKRALGRKNFLDRLFGFNRNFKIVCEDLDEAASYNSTLFLKWKTNIHR